jgi:hypothetical protein
MKFDAPLDGGRVLLAEWDLAGDRTDGQDRKMKRLSNGVILPSGLTLAKSRRDDSSNRTWISGVQLMRGL